MFTVWLLARLLQHTMICVPFNGPNSPDFSTLDLSQTFRSSYFWLIDSIMMTDFYKFLCSSFDVRIHFRLDIQSHSFMPKISHINGKYCGTAPKINYYSNRFHKAMFSPLVSLADLLFGRARKVRKKTNWNGFEMLTQFQSRAKKKPSHGSPPRHWRDFVLVVAILRNCLSKEISAHESRPEFRLPLNPDTTHSRQTWTCGFSLKTANQQHAMRFFPFFLLAYPRSRSMSIALIISHKSLFFFFSPLHPSVAFMPTLQSLH